MKRLFSIIAILCCMMSVSAAIPPSLHVEGNQLKDTHGNTVVLHGVMDTPSQWFNSGRWGWGGYDATDAPSKCIAYFDKLFTAITDASQGAHCTVFRLHLDPCWTNNGNLVADGFTQKNVNGENKWYDPNGTEVGGEADIHGFDKTRLAKFLNSVYVPLIQKALGHGLYVIIRPPGVFPQTVKVGDYYNQYLMTVWDMVSKNATIQKYSGQVSIELGNEPVGLRNADGSDTPAALHDFFQPIVEKIRANGFNGIIWVPGTGYQSNYTSYATKPITGYNIGYAVHCYTGWYGQEDNNANGQTFIQNFAKQVPVVKTNPIVITEVDWSPSSGEPDLNPDGSYKTNYDGSIKTKNFGTWATGSTSKWGNAYKEMKDYYGNISMTLTSTDDLIDMDYYLSTKKVRPAFQAAMEEKDMDPMEACGAACMAWYADYAKVDFPRPDYTNQSNSLSSDQTKFYNPVIMADFPDPDVTMLGDTYYMISSTFVAHPGATILKSHDLVNWEYCCNPMEKIGDEDKFSLLNGENAYAGGMWASALQAHDGKLYLLVNANHGGSYLFTTDNPEGAWDMQQLDRGYYDPGLLFDGDNVYIASGIGRITISKLDKNFHFLSDQVVLTDKDGLEGCHLYKIGDYYYIYATYGGWPSGQAIFRSKNINGPYEEKMLIEKVINNVPNTVHQGALVQTPTGEWWTMLMEDKGAVGRMPSLHPVTWSDGWPTLCKNGVPQGSYTRPNIGTTYPVTYLPTNDNFRDYRLGKQWQWNHMPDAAGWSLFDRPGYLRLYTSSVTDDFMQARNTLTQRIFAFHKTASPYGIDGSHSSQGTVCFDVRNMIEGDFAGISVLQDPYALIGVKVVDGKYKFVWKSGVLHADNFTPAEQSVDAQIDSVVYLRATFNASTSRVLFYYSTDNLRFTKLGETVELRFNLSVFNGARFGLFNYATKELGGYVDFDWFTTEKKFSEETYFDPNFEPFDKNMITCTSLQADAPSMEVMIGAKAPVTLTATFADGHSENVAAKASYAVANPELVEVTRGNITGLQGGETEVVATYIDPLGNVQKCNFAVSTTYFPFSATYFNPSIFADGTYVESSKTLTTGSYGFGGWTYPQGIDLSNFNYLVVKLKKSANSKANLSIRLFDDSNYFGSRGCYIKNFSQTARVDLRSMKTNKNLDFDRSHVYIIGFWTVGGYPIQFDSAFLSDDGYTPSGIDAVLFDSNSDGIHQLSDDAPVYDLSGRRVQTGTSLKAGIYVRNGQKIVVRP